VPIKQYTDILRSTRYYEQTPETTIQASDNISHDIFQRSPAQAGSPTSVERRLFGYTEERPSTGVPIKQYTDILLSYSWGPWFNPKSVHVGLVVNKTGNAYTVVLINP